MGTPALAAHILERLVTASGANFRVVGVVTRPDKPRGRGLGTEPSEVGCDRGETSDTDAEAVEDSNVGILERVESVRA